ncbi:hypothetical protein [Kitasatospora sp. NPDC085464]|uniref:hypothetical protein n=1 Tax=Kitasatospora sp. NPDC085464 TaxID=3364063 RepID=UPI0037CA4FB7
MAAADRGEVCLAELCAGGPGPLTVLGCVAVGLIGGRVADLPLAEVEGGEAAQHLDLGEGGEPALAAQGLGGEPGEVHGVVEGAGHEGGLGEQPDVDRIECLGVLQLSDDRCPPGERVGEGLDQQHSGVTG